MSQKIKISLLGAKTYSTLTSVFKKGEPHLVDEALWADLQKETNPVTGMPLFCLTQNFPKTARSPGPDISGADLRASGLEEIDTGVMQPAISTDVPDGADRSDLDAIDPAPVPPTDTKSAPNAPKTASIPPRKLTVGGVKAVTV